MCGYKVQYKLFELKKFNIPQKRERVFIVGVLKNINNSFIFSLKN